MEGKTDLEGVKLICLGYKYNKKKVLTFLMKRDAGATTKGIPYVAKFPDKYGNMYMQHGARPQIISNYFRFSNQVDLHNQARQFDIALEKNG